MLVDVNLVGGGDANCGEAFELEGSVVAAAAEPVAHEHGVDLHRRYVAFGGLLDVARQLLVQRVHGFVAVDVDHVVAGAPVAGDVGADDVVVEYRLDDLVLLVGLGGLQGAPDQPLLLAGKGGEHDGLVEFELAHHARQLHHGSGAAAVVTDAGGR